MSKSTIRLVVLVTVIVDLSGSLDGYKNEVEEALDRMFGVLGSDLLASRTVRVSLVTFADEPKATPYLPVSAWASRPSVTTGGSTPFWAALALFCQGVRTEVTRLASEGIEVSKNIAVLASDMRPTDEAGQVPSLVHQTERELKVNLIPVALGDADMAVGNSVSAERQAVRLKGYDFKGLFRWVTEVTKTATTTRPGERMKIAKPDCIEFA